MTERAKAIAARFLLSPAEPDDPDVRACMERYLAARGFPLDTRSTADRWARLTDNGEVVAIVGVRAHAGTRFVEITDLYPGPGRNGVLGVYAVMRFVKSLVDSRVIDCATGAVAAANKPHNRAIERVFGVQPEAYLFLYGTWLPAATPATTAGANEIFGLSSVTLDQTFRNVFARTDDTNPVA
jgi:hypothetical protein